MDDQDAIAEARDIIETGWCKGALHKDADGHTIEDGFNANRETSCLLGAINLVAMDEEQERRLQKATLKGIAKLTGNSGNPSPQISIPGFNDQPSTTQEDAVLALKYAEETLGEKK